MIVVQVMSGTDGSISEGIYGDVNRNIPTSNNKMNLVSVRVLMVSLSCRVSSTTRFQAHSHLSTSAPRMVL